MQLGKTEFGVRGRGGGVPFLLHNRTQYLILRYVTGALLNRHFTEIAKVKASG